ncbi:hypothetical protein NA57DRAFT_41962 [Rhizodiscina lignyota]|uniref:ZZ-type domain-containing protein n=1 Tax=Rhizodiscina lignyota TaxID=1504668 RepID=A0A9P4I770_9PEZI|nr:hypothetical protein NA57DRAFT_41962 [Rhizodiscina lignyota]
MATNTPVTMETLISVKITYQGTNKKFKVPLGDLGPNNLPDKLRQLLDIPEDKLITFERFSDSAGAYITLDPANLQAYKTLYRAAKAKLKLRLRATSLGDEVVLPVPSPPVPTPTVNLRNFRQKTTTKMLMNPIFSASEATLNNPTGGVRVSSATSVRQPEVKAEAEDEAPLPRAFHAREAAFFSELAEASRANLALRTKEPQLLPQPTNGHADWSVYCNGCEARMPHEHYHCNVCDSGDFDLCTSCISAGKHCHEDKHFLIKRYVRDNKVVSSTTERVATKPKVEVETKAEVEKKMPGAYAADEKKPYPEEPRVPTRTCNSCVKVFDENQFLTCQTCEDYDLCEPCLKGNKHGHHPAHAFTPAVDGSGVSPLARFLATAGRNVLHNALCDECDCKIYGVRHKCLNCPDWDYCSKCFEKAATLHPGHRFVPIYEPYATPHTFSTNHHGIYCDGPLCNKNGTSTKSFIQGVRYKCAICHDTDFCASCEASPANKHNRTHPLIKFKTPVRNVSVTTMGEDKNGSLLATMGDNSVKASARVPVSPPRTTHTVSKIQPIVDVKPVEEPATKPIKEKIEIKDLLAEPIKEKLKVQDLLTAEKSPMERIPLRKSLSVRSAITASGDQLNAHFVRDTITDGTEMSPSQRFIQIWTLRNPGPHAWPAGCRVRYVGGDMMLNVEDSLGGIVGAAGSNVIQRVVKVGEEVHFRVLMKAPQRVGTSISYWRLKSPDNTPFGHRLWCHIDVVEKDAKAISPAQALETTADSSKAPAEDKEMNNLLEEFNRKRALMAEAIKKQEERVKALEEVQKRKQKLSEDEDRAKRTEPEVKAEAEVKVEPEVKAEPEVKQEVEAEKSTMIFPKLEKESPSSSTHESAIPSSPATAVTARSQATTVASPATEEPEIFEDAESVEIIEESTSSDEDGFLTDEEYDILDASDEELA